jgi:3D (Asp-Asp-Asp) domain-containing protein
MTAMRKRSRRIAAPPAFVVLAALAALLALSASACRERHSLVVTATAYNSVPSQTDHLPTRAAWGDELRPGMRVIAVSPDLLERGLDRGTRVHVEGLPGTYRVLDKTHGRFRRRVDVYMGEDVERAREWGAREVRITWFD